MAAHVTRATSSTSPPPPAFSGPWLEPLPSAEPSLGLLPDDEVTPSRRARTRDAERNDLMGPGAAGMLAGTFAGPAALLALEEAGRRLGKTASVAADFGGRLAPTLAGSIAAVLPSFALAALMGGVVGAVHALATRHLRRAAPLVFFSVVANAAVVTALYAFAVLPSAPWVAARAPYAACVIASAVFGLAASLQLPLRTRTRPS
jgi:hypothetical protein